MDDLDEAVSCIMSEVRSWTALAPTLELVRKNAEDLQIIGERLDLFTETTEEIDQLRRRHLAAEALLQPYQAAHRMVVRARKETLPTTTTPVISAKQQSPRAKAGDVPGEYHHVSFVVCFLLVVI